ncbi:ABC transporter ATP-binding protein [Nonomuraea gerenzanensis]|uniref:Lipid A export ATP-binding/permease protein MsbA n=1 Tax=Nonomuraea gerenzanensis TaxID=93944 RepID=A0A1M4E886_9ACTN|nr:ABC transporter ATP-binding protein [Nonomuraea gerenzanensis]UBU17281.1 ABC transporter ATP-binding protein/permease [Nonomuraea gerenzanensis]SBO95025.1 Lipid A export ATP-binding/permease protein MsbA [Nonomuraea gerenzanensis]
MTAASGRPRGALRTLLLLAWRTDRRAGLVLAAFLLSGAVSHGLVGVFLRELTDTATSGHPAQAALWALAAGAALAAGVALGRAELALMQELAERMGLAVQEEILTLTAGIPTIEHLERPAYLDRLRTLREESGQLYFAVWAVALVVEHAAQIGLGVALMAAVHPLLPLLLGGAVLPSLLVRGRAASHLDTAAERTAEAGRLEQHLSETVTAAEPAKEVRLSGAAPALDGMAVRHWEEVSEVQARAGIRAGLLTFAGSATFLGGYVAALGCVAWLAREGLATAGDLVLVATVGVQFVTQASRLAFHFGAVTAGLRAATRLTWLRTYARRSSPPEGAGARLPERLTDGITLHRVSFTYPGTTRRILHDLDLHLPAGATVALVGAHGSGKTTLAKLLCALYHPDRGEIRADDVPLHDLTPQAWRQRVSAVFQDLARFELTAAETVGVGDLPRLGEHAAVVAAMARAGASGLIAALPDGLHTELGDTFERGHRPSGGQWQQLALARAAMRRSPLLLVLDEPTASLDAATESAVFARYAQAARRHPGAVTLLITHRFPTVRTADLIVVLDAGRIVQRGTHADLIASPGPYADLYTVQRDAYPA